MEEFASQNGLFLHPSNPIDSHIERVESNGGGCPCAPDRTCPCPEAISECNDQTRPEGERCCTCRIVVSHDYLVEWGYAGDKKTGKKKTPATTPAPEPVPDEIKDAAMKIVSVVKSAREVLKKDPNNASEILMNALETVDCSTCEAFLIANALRSQVAGIMCSAGGESDCTRAQKDAEDGLTRIIDLYEEVAGVKKSPATNGVKPGDKRRQCVSESLKSDELAEALNDLGITDPKNARNIRFYISVKKCSANPVTIEEGIQLAREEHPDWFVGATK